MTTNTSAKLVDTAGAAEYLSLSTSILAKWRVAGCGPRFLKLGSAVRYDIADLNAFKAAGMRQSTSEQAAA